MATHGAQQALVPGRVVLIRHPASGLPELGVICGAPAGAGRSMGLASSSGNSTAAGAFLRDACVFVPHRFCAAPKSVQSMRGVCKSHCRARQAWAWCGPPGSEL